MNVPTLQKERIYAIDIIRGFALIGIFFVNFPAMNGLDFEVTALFTSADLLVRLFYDIFIQTKFYSIFAFLFGLGFYLFMNRAEAKGAPFTSLFIRRLGILLLIGLTHYIIFWEGDILHTYALIGLLLLPFYKKEPKTMLKWAIGLLASFHLLMLSALFATIPAKNPGTFFNYFQGTIQGITDRINGIPVTFATEIFLLPEILGLFLLGLYVGKKRIFENIDAYQQQISRFQKIALLLSLCFIFPTIKGFLTSDSYQSSSYFFWTLMSGKTLAVFYVTTLMLLLRKSRWQQRLRPLQYLGQMALTNYLIQTLLIVVILSIFMKNTAVISLWMQPFIVIGILLFQIQFSKWWLKRFSFGPVEWLWRIATYGQNYPLKKKAS